MLTPKRARLVLVLALLVVFLVMLVRMLYVPVSEEAILLTIGTAARVGQTKNGELDELALYDMDGAGRLLLLGTESNLGPAGVLVQRPEDDTGAGKKVPGKKAPGKKAPANNADLSTADGSAFSVAKEYLAIMAMLPVVIFLKLYCGFLKRLKGLLSQLYAITPQPAIVELDLHKHGKELQQYIGEMLGRYTVPNLFVAGVLHGGCDDIVALHEAGTLVELLLEWGGKHIQVTSVV